MSNFPPDISQEIHKARKARELGFEGRARVCARRAAGLAVRAYFLREGIATNSMSAYDLIKRMTEIETVPPQLKSISQHLLLRVDAAHQLPSDVDLIADAEYLINTLSNEEE